MTPDFRNIVGEAPERHDYSLGLNCGAFLRAEWAARAMKAGLPAGARVLEVGSGLGWAADVFRRLGFEVFSIDASEEAVRESARRYPACHFERADAAEFVRRGEFDAVLAFEVIEHLRDWERAAANWKASLKPGGRLFLSTPNRRYSMDNPLKPANPHHLREFTPAELRGLFPGCELRGINLTVSRSLRWRSTYMRAIFRLAALLTAPFEDEKSYEIAGRANFNKREMLYHLMGKRLPAFSEGLWLSWRKPA